MGWDIFVALTCQYHRIYVLQGAYWFESVVNILISFVPASEHLYSGMSSGLCVKEVETHFLTFVIVLSVSCTPLR